MLLGGLSRPRHLDCLKEGLFCEGLLSPKILEPLRRLLGVANRLLNILVAQIRLQSPGIVTPIRQRKSKLMSEHVRA